VDDQEVSKTSSLPALYASSFLIVVGNALVAFSPAPALIERLGIDSATRVLSTLSSTAALLQILLGPAIGSLMDSAGRKPIALASLLALVLVNGAVSLHPTVVCIAIAKVMSSFVIGIFFIASQTILSDTTALQPEKLSSFMGIQMTLTSLGFLCGAIGAGQLAEKGLRVSYGSSAAVLLTASLVFAVLMKETLPSTIRSSSQGNDGATRRKFVLRSPFASLRIFKHKELRTMLILLMLSSIPMFMGEVFQIYAKAEWDLETKKYSSFIAMFGVVGILGNLVGSVLVRKVGIKTFTAMATLSSLCVPIGATFFQFRGIVIGAMIGFLSSAQTLGISAALVNQGSKLGIPQGELAGDRSSIIALLKVVGPIWYSLLYVQGKRLSGWTNMPFIFNIFIALLAFSISMVRL